MKKRRQVAGPSEGERRALELSAMFAEAGWIPPTENFADRPHVKWHGQFFSCAGAPPGHGHVSKCCQTEQEVIDFLNSFVEVETEDEPAPAPTIIPEENFAPDPAEAPVQPLNHPDESDPVSEALVLERAENERLRAENEALKEKLAEVESATPLPPNPAETKLSDYIPAEISALMEPGETFTMARKRLSELLNVEKAELRLKRAAGSASDDDLKREADVDRLQGLFSKLGEI